MPRNPKPWHFYLPCLLSLVLALLLAFHGLELGVTAEEGGYAPSSACDAACRKNLNDMEREGDHWMLGAELLLLTSGALLYLGRRTSKRISNRQRA